MLFEDVLKCLGLEREDTQIYLNLLESGPSTAGALAKRISMARATTYDALKRLTSIGVVVVAQEQGVKNFRAEIPERLNRLFDKRVKDLQLSQHVLNQTVPLLNKRRFKGILPPKFEMFEGLESVKNAMNDFLFHHDIDSFNFWSTEMVSLLGMEHFFYSNRKRLENNIRQKLIVVSPETFSVKKYPFLGEGNYFKRELRVAPEDIGSQMSYWVYSNKVLFLSSRVEAYAYIIQSDEMAKLMKEHFLSLWQISKPYKTKKGETDPFISYMERSQI